LALESVELEELSTRTALVERPVTDGVVVGTVRRTAG
jgi:hypothetical protein